MQEHENSLGFLIADVSRLMRRAFQRKLEGSDLTMAQAKALVFVSRHEGVRQVDLADYLELQPMTLVRLIDGLQKQGLVERRANPSDRRAYDIYLTPQAEPQLAQIKQVAEEIKAFAFSELDSQQTEQFISALTNARQKLNQI
ncbi:MarR family winged helix-turn-helix transcriptional regulator [Neptunicella marina]|uniref:MarR family transcriptional regulator n=1 Tax=Neptunicella marina TaxID=2125989 RepID=A0A8J6IVE1_9ALTE|nr:MarR family transcriptional regulator [Neptunicella marina]MBC3766482.1 MarR family transcriptional regulator [Neptunicella marina]